MFSIHSLNVSSDDKTQLSLNILVVVLDDTWLRAYCFADFN